MKFIDSIKDLLKPKELDKDLQIFEVKLQQILIPVKPRPQFTKTLRQSIVKQFPGLDLRIEKPGHQILKTGLLVSGGVVGSFFVVLTGIRGFISVLGLIGLLISRHKQYSQEPIKTTGVIQGI